MLEVRRVVLKALADAPQRIPVSADVHQRRCVGGAGAGHNTASQIIRMEPSVNVDVFQISPISTLIFGVNQVYKVQNNEGDAVIYAGKSNRAVSAVSYYDVKSSAGGALCKPVCKSIGAVQIFQEKKPRSVRMMKRSEGSI